MAVAKDQNGCRFLQRKFDEGGPAAIQAVLPEVLEHLIELMMDPFGNYLIQKLLDRCSEDQRLAVGFFIVGSVTKSSSVLHLHNASLAGMSFCRCISEQGWLYCRFLRRLQSAKSLFRLLSTRMEPALYRS